VSNTGEESDRRLCMLVVCKQVIDGKSRDQEEAQTIRRTEMLRHFPIVARQFNYEGKLMDQNSEAVQAFGSSSNATPSETIVPLNKPRKEGMPNGSQKGLKSSVTPVVDSNPAQPGEIPDVCHFISQFVDKDEGRQVFEEVREGHDYSTETQQMTLKGPKWFTLNVRRIQDPVTSEQVIIYSAKDITKAMESAKVEADRLNIQRSEFCK
jgi:hypothetical protein